MHSVVECDKDKDTAIFETAVTVQDNPKIVRYRVWLSAWKGLENRQRSGAQSKTYMLDVVAPPDWTIDKVPQYDTRISRWNQSAEILKRNSMATR